MNTNEESGSNNMERIIKTIRDFGAGGLGVMTFGAYHYIVVCRENDKQLEMIEKNIQNAEKKSNYDREIMERNRETMEKNILHDKEMRKIEYELQLKKIDEKLKRGWW